MRLLTHEGAPNITRKRPPPLQKKIHEKDGKDEKDEKDGKDGKDGKDETDEKDEKDEKEEEKVAVKFNRRF